MPQARLWCDLPDSDDQVALETAARRFWSVPAGAAIIAAPGASSLIARIPALATGQRVDIPGPTYNEHARAFSQSGWDVVADTTGSVDARVLVHPNNPDGRLHSEGALRGASLSVIDESFCDVAPGRSLVRLADRPGHIILKSFGKFWGLAGLRLGFAIGPRDLIDRLAGMLGPWPVSGPALSIATKALGDTAWAEATRERLAEDAARLDGLAAGNQMRLVGGTSLFRLYETKDAKALHIHLANQKILTRIFPYSDRWIRFGLPGNPSEWSRLEAAL